MNSRISVVIPTYNRSRLVGRAVESALANIMSGDEIIVIDDGSTDDTAEILRPFYDKIRYIRTENSGPGAARNLGVKRSMHSLVTFLDSDDEWLADKLYLQRTVMDAFPHVVFSFSNMLARRPDGEMVSNILNLWRNDPRVGYKDVRESLDEILGAGIPFSSIGYLPADRADFNVHMGDIYKPLMEVSYVWTCTVMVRKEIAGTSFWFAEDQHLCEDWECYGRLAKLGFVAYLNCELAVQIVHSETSRLSDVGDIQMATSRIKMLHRVWGADDSFLRVHSSRFQSILNAQHLWRAKCLIKEGRMEEAKEDLRLAGGGPWSYRLLTSMSPRLIDTFLRLRRKMRILTKG